MPVWRLPVLWQMGQKTAKIPADETQGYFLGRFIVRVNQVIPEDPHAIRINQALRRHWSRRLIFCLQQPLGYGHEIRFIPGPNGRLRLG